MANCKYQKKQYKYSNDNGQTWHNVVPEQIKAGDLIEYDSPDCSSIDAIYRWAELDGQYICVDNVKYTKEIRYESYDAGATWYVSYPAVYRAGQRVGVDEDFCNDKFEGHYVPGGDTSCPKWYKWNGYKCVYVDPIKVVKCDGNPTLTTADTAYYVIGYELISAKIGDCLTSIGDWTFQQCSGLTSVTIGTGVTSIGKGALYGCSSLTGITIPNSVTSIGDLAFEFCSDLTSVTIGTGVTSIGYMAFGYCYALTSVTIPDSVKSINESTFFNCSGLTSVTIGTGVTSIGYGAFKNCSSLTGITIPNSVTSIDNSAFENCSGLTSVTIGNSVTSIGRFVFNNCTGLTSFTCLATTPPTLGVYALDNTNENLKIFVPAASVDTFKNASEWKKYADRILAIP